MLWVGTELSAIEQLSMRSFVACGHDVELFTYGKVVGIPGGVRVRDANEVLPESRVFYYKRRRSVAAFANWFRYRMLYEQGGVWVDTDVICLRRFDFDCRLFFGRQDFETINNAVLGAEKGHPLFKWMANQAEFPNRPLPYDTSRDRWRKWRRKYLQGNRQGNVKWGEAGPLGLTRAIQHFELQEFALPYTAFYPVHFQCWDAIFDSTYPSPEAFFPNSYAIHVWNEMIRSHANFDKNARFPSDSLIEALKRRYA